MHFLRLNSVSRHKPSTSMFGFHSVSVIIDKSFLPGKKFNNLLTFGASSQQRKGVDGISTLMIR
jgi:hypothetical protein